MHTTTDTAARRTPGDVIRPGVEICEFGRMRWTVKRDGQIGVISDEEGMKSGRWAAWSPYAATRHNMAAFTDDPAEAVDAILATLPIRSSALAKEAGTSAAEVLDEADALAAEWSTQGHPAVFHSTVCGGDAELTGAAALVIREVLAKKAAAQEALALTAALEWRTLKGLQAPFFLYGEERERGWIPAGDRKQATGQPLKIIRVWMDGTRYAEDEQGREIHLYGAATKFWAAPADH